MSACSTGRITESEHDRFHQSLREQIADIDTRLAMLQEAEDNYYITAKYLLELMQRAYELFVSSEVEERRQLIKLVLQNLRVDGKIVRYDGIKPFNTILNYADDQLWLAYWNDYRHANWQQASLYSEQVNELNALVTC